ncbi:hypothetical protein BGZ76_005553 [Entomortierella beljakovae]|nr:hypothetical protein BGZ76_005553 [Entomortierella beljakovae]
MTLEQAQEHVQRKRQTVLEEQVQLEQRQRLRQQQELQVQLAKHRNAILEQQQLQQKALQDELQEFRTKQKQQEEIEKQLQLEQQQQEQQQQQQQQQKQEQQLARSRHDQKETVELTAQKEKESTKDIDSSMTSIPQYVPMRNRSMFGYRGPINEDQDHGDAKSIIAKTTTTTTLSEMISAENRVRLTLLDYTPKQINTMTSAQADTILASKQQAQLLQDDSREMLSDKGDKEVDEAEYYSLDITPFVSGSVNSNMHLVRVSDVMSSPSHDPSNVAMPSRRASS